MTTWLVVAAVVMLWATYSCLGWMDFIDWRTGLAKQSRVAIGRLFSIRPKVGTGTKGYVAWRTHETLPDAIWIPYRHPLVGSHLMVSARSGWGPHHDEQVAYVSKVHRVMLPGSWLTFRLVSSIARAAGKLSSVGRKKKAHS